MTTSDIPMSLHHMSIRLLRVLKNNRFLGLRIIDVWPKYFSLTSSFLIADQEFVRQWRILCGREQHPAARWASSKGIQPGGVERRRRSQRDPDAAQDSHHTRYSNARVSSSFFPFLRACHRARVVRRHESRSRDFIDTTQSSNERPNNARKIVFSR